MACGGVIFSKKSQMKKKIILFYYIQIFEVITAP